MLTENRDKYFVSHKPPGAPATIFSLAYKPLDFDEAKQRYDEWTQVLVEKDYPIFFSGIKLYDEPEVPVQPAKPVAGRRKAPSRRGYESLGVSPLLSHPELPAPVLEGSPKPPVDACNRLAHSDSLPTLCLDLGKWLDNDIMSHAELLRHDDPCFPVDLCRESVDLLKDGRPHSMDNNQSLDIPKSLDDVVEVRESSIPNAGRGVFAKRRIPKHTIVGFYFGVPLTEDEFDCVKEKIGQASQYAVRFRSRLERIIVAKANGSGFDPDSIPVHRPGCHGRERSALFGNHLPFPVHQRGQFPCQRCL